MSESLIRFWSNIENVKNASPEDIQSDILTYLRRMEHYKRRALKAEERVRELEDQLNEELPKPRYRMDANGNLTLIKDEEESA